jgi:hypothetical protein
VCGSCSTSEVSTGNTKNSSISMTVPNIDSYQATVDALKQLLTQQQSPSIVFGTTDSPRLDGWFDVNQIFSVLNHLSMQAGYTLDYVYSNNGLGARPYIYARIMNAKPFNTLAELTATYIDDTVDHAFDYLHYVKTDNSEEAFFQYIVLRIMGGQFYLWWHAGYDDYTVICNRVGLQAILSATTYGDTLPKQVQNEALGLNLAPTIDIQSDTVSVRVVTFTKWGGFIEQTYMITRTFPHIVKEKRTKILVAWKINLVF